MWRRVDLVSTDVSEERVASIFRLEKSASEEPVWTGGRWQQPAHIGSSLADFSSLKMEATRSSETSVDTRSTWRHIPGDILHSHRCEYLKSYAGITAFFLMLFLCNVEWLWMIIISNDGCKDLGGRRKRSVWLQPIRCWNINSSWAILEY
jgi:hypothetical protein